MDRLDALETVKDQVTALYDFLQMEAVDVAIDGEDVEAIDDLATACETALEWCKSETKKKEFGIAEESPRDPYEDAGQNRGMF